MILEHKKDTVKHASPVLILRLSLTPNISFMISQIHDYEHLTYPNLGMYIFSIGLIVEQTKKHILP